MGIAVTEPTHRRAADHYSKLTASDDQTSPGVVGVALDDALQRHPFAEPILDVGTGMGTNLEALATRTLAFGTDISVSPLTSAQGHAPVAAADAARLPFRDASFAAAVCTEVLEHVDDPAAVFREIARVLRPNGLAFVTAPNYANLAGVHKWLADRRTGRHDWNPWGAHEGGYEAFMTGRRLAAAARPVFDIVEARALDYGQALTGRFRPLDRLAQTRGAQSVLRRLLPRLHRPDRRLLSWHGMHVAMVLRRREDH